jgi:hypothetical protein
MPKANREKGEGDYCPQRTYVVKEGNRGYDKHRGCVYTQQLTDFSGAHESLKGKLGDIIRRHYLLFRNFTIYFL